MPDDLASTLAGIRERAEGPMRKFGDVDASQRDVLPLVAAVEAVLELHTRRLVKTRNICAEHTGWMGDSGHLFRTAVELCPDCTATEHYTCASCRHICPDDDEWPCAEYQAIAAALAGKDGNHGH